MLAVDEDQVLADLRALAGFGKLDTGVNRPGRCACGEVGNGTILPFVFRAVSIARLKRS